jgi:hypothetical protein
MKQHSIAWSSVFNTIRSTVKASFQSGGGGATLARTCRRRLFPVHSFRCLPCATPEGAKGGREGREREMAMVRQRVTSRHVTSLHFTRSFLSSQIEANTKRYHKHGAPSYYIIQHNTTQDETAHFDFSLSRLRLRHRLHRLPHARLWRPWLLSTLPRWP